MCSVCALLLACPDDDKVRGWQGVPKDGRAEHVVLKSLQAVSGPQRPQERRGVGIGQFSILKGRWVRVLARFLENCVMKLK